MARSETSTLYCVLCVVDPASFSNDTMIDVIGFYTLADAVTALPLICRTESVDDVEELARWALVESYGPITITELIVREAWQGIANTERQMNGGRALDDGYFFHWRMLTQFRRDDKGLDETFRFCFDPD